MTTRALAPFFAITFGIAWTILGLYIYLNEPMARAFGQISGKHPLFVLAVYSPAIAALILVAWCGGAAGLKRYLSRALLWRCPAPWAVFLIFGIPLIFVAGAAVKGNLLTDPFPFSSVGAAVLAMAFMLVLGPIEEFGWRGLALPLMQRHLAPILAGLILGIIWGIWHLPAFLLGGTPQSTWGFAPFFIGSVSVSVVLTPLFNRTRGSILLAALFHFQLINPLCPDAQPYDTIFFAATAVVVVWLNRATMFTRDGAVTEVIPAAPSAA